MRSLLVSLPDHVAKAVSERAIVRRMPVEDIAGQLIGAALGQARAVMSEPEIVKFHVRFRPKDGRTVPFGWNARLGVLAYLLGSTDEMAFAVVYDDGHFGTAAARDCVLDDGDEGAELPASASAVVVDQMPDFPPLPVRKAVQYEPVKHDASAAEILLAYIDGQKVYGFVTSALTELIRVVRERQQPPMPLDEMIYATVRDVIERLRTANIEARQ